MIGAIPATGNGFRGLVSYLMHGKQDGSQPDRVDWAETGNLAVDDPELAVVVMRATARQSVKCQKPVQHLVVSWHEDEKPSPDQMRAVAYDLLSSLGLEEHQRLLVSHKDKAHKHLHMVVNRVHPETHKAWDRWQSKIRVEKAMAELAQKHGFMVVPGRHNQAKDFEHVATRATTEEQQAAKRQALPEPPPHLTKAQIADKRTRLVETIAKAKSWTELVRALEADGFTLERKGQGLVIVADEGYLKLSELKKDIRLGGLEDRFGERYDDYALSRGMVPDYHKVTPASETAADDQSSLSGISATEVSPTGAEASGEPERPRTTSHRSSPPPASSGSGDSDTPPPAPLDATGAPSAPQKPRRDKSQPRTSAPVDTRTPEEKAAAIEALRNKIALQRLEAAEEKKRKDEERKRQAEVRATQKAIAQAEQKQKAAAKAVAPPAPTRKPEIVQPTLPQPAMPREDASTKLLTKDEKARIEAQRSLRRARDTADLAFKLFNAGMISRKQLAQANRDREEAEANVYGLSDLGSQITSDIRKELAPGNRDKTQPETGKERSKPPRKAPPPDSKPPQAPKKSRRGRGR